MAIILGIDPGSRKTGYGVICASGNKLEYIASGCVRTAGEDFPQRIKQIFDGIAEVISLHIPQHCAIEEVFMGKSAASALKLGQARGAAMSAALAQDLPVSEYSARKVKQALVGSGAADKSQVEHMVKILLAVEGKLQEDAADALAIAICHANTTASLIRMAGAKSFSRKRFR